MQEIFTKKKGFGCVEVLRPNLPIGVMSTRSVYLTTLLQDRLSPLGDAIES